MSTISWVKAASANWSDPSAWAGGAVPGAADTAVISVAGHSYKVLINGAVTVGGLVLDDAKATLELSSSLTSSMISLEAGTFLLEGGSVTGTVTEQAGVLEIARNDKNTFNNVTWQGNLDPVYLQPNSHHKFGTLTINGGLTLTGPGGSGPGSANFTGPVVLNDVASLNNATITAGTLQIANSPSLTLGAGLTLDCANLSSGSGTLVNDGSLDTPTISSGTLINNGTLATSNLNYSFSTNNGLIVVAPGSSQLQLVGLTNSGTILVSAGQSIAYNNNELPVTTGAGVTMIDGGAVDLYYSENDPITTTAQLLALYSSQNIVETGAYGVTFEELNNVGATLDIGPTSLVGTLAALAAPSSGGGPVVDSGTVVNNGAGPMFSGVEITYPYDFYTYAQFNSLTLQSSSPTLDLGQVNLQDVVVTGATTLDAGAEEYGGQYVPPGLGVIVGGTLNISTLNVSDPFTNLPAGLALYDVDITGGRGGKLDVSISNNATLNLVGETLGSFALAIDGGTLVYNEIDTATVNVTAASVASTLNGSTLGADVNIHVSAGAELVQGFLGYLTETSSADVKVSAGGTYYIENSAGTFINNGTIDVVKGVLALNPEANLQNNGSISVTDGTLVLIGGLTLASLGVIPDPGSVLAIGGYLDLGGSSVTLGQGGVPQFVLQGGQISDGTLTIGPGKAYSWTGAATVNANLVNNADVTITGGTGLGYYSDNAAINDALSGSGTIGLSAANGSGETLTISSTVASSQTLAFIGSDDALQFSTTEAAYGFLGTLSGFAVGDSLVIDPFGVASASFVGDTIVIEASTNITLATATALHGSLAVTSSGSYFETITYVSTASSIKDWSAGDIMGRDHGELAGAVTHFAGGTDSAGRLPQDWFVPIHQS